MTKKLKKVKSLNNSVLDTNQGQWHNRILIATPTTGTVRMEWVHARYGQIIPTNWSQVEMTQWMNNYIPSEYLLADAENLIAKQVVENNYEWLLSIEEDNILPRDAFVRINEYMTKGDIPIVSGLYFTKSNPTEPILYRGRGNGSFRNFKMGQKVWVDGVPFGFTLIHGNIIRALWDESEEYSVGNQVTRKVFNLPDRNFSDEAGFGAIRGTTDLQWCTRLIDDKILKKAGFPKIQLKKYPFLVDTNLFIQHVDKQGRMYPLNGVPKEYLK